MAFINPPSEWDFSGLRRFLIGDGNVINPPSEWNFTRMQDTWDHYIGHRYRRQDLFDPVMRPVWHTRDYDIDVDVVKNAVGIFMVGLGSGILVPGPGDIAAGAAGVIIFKHPIGSVLGVAAYNLTGVGLIWSGSSLIS